MSEQSAIKAAMLKERTKRNSAECKAKSLQEKLDYANQERFGERRQRVRKKTATEGTGKPDPERKDEKDGFDGTEDTLRIVFVEGNPPQGAGVTSMKERDLSNRPDEYKKMGVNGDPVFHPLDLSKVPGRIIERKTVQVFSLRMPLVEERYHYAEPGRKPQWGYFPTEGHPEVVTKFEGTKATPEFLGDAELKSIMSDGYNAYVFIGDQLKSAQFKDTVHQVCLSPRDNKFVKAGNQGNEPNAELFSNHLKEFFANEHRYDEACLSPEEWLRERQSLATKAIVIRIRSRLDSELAKDPESRSQYYTEVLNYLNHFWDEIFAFLKDGEFPIDNNLTERTIRKRTTQRNNSFHYGSDAGAEIAATYQNVIGTVKLHGSSF